MKLYYVSICIYIKIIYKYCISYIYIYILRILRMVDDIVASIAHSTD